MGKFQASKEEIGPERNVSHVSRSTQFKIYPGSCKFLDVSI